MFSILIRANGKVKILSFFFSETPPLAQGYLYR